MIEIRTSIPTNYYKILDEMAKIDAEDSEEEFIRRIVVGGIEALAESPDFVRYVYQERWKGLLEK